MKVAGKNHGLEIRGARADIGPVVGRTMEHGECTGRKSPGQAGRGGAFLAGGEGTGQFMQAWIMADDQDRREVVVERRKAIEDPGRGCKVERGFDAFLDRAAARFGKPAGEMLEGQPRAAGRGYEGTGRNPTAPGEFGAHGDGVPFAAVCQRPVMIGAALGRRTGFPMAQNI